ncbi:MAG: dipeptidase PepE [Candidatus Uhrbacteria bacterium]|nr:dipeptidase PepE [Candidatus Uhrbacteria bacterium]
MKRRLLLISNSKPHGGGYLDHCEEAIKAFLGPIKNILFFPFALQDWEGYASVARERFFRMGIKLVSVRDDEVIFRMNEGIETAEAFFVGGGNTFRLLMELLKTEPGGEVVLSQLRNRIFAGIPYIGTSAGANLACPTIMTTNDMPIVYPKTFNALDVFPYQINPYYIDPDPSSQHMGETRDVRLKEFHEEHETPIVALREGAWLRMENGRTHLGGENGAKLFYRGSNPIELYQGAWFKF